MLWLVRNRWKAFVVGLLIMVIGLVFASQLEMASSMEDMMSEDNPVILRTEAFNEHFPTNESAVLVIKGDGEVAKPFIKAVHRELADKTYIHSVISSFDVSGQMTLSSDDGLTHMIVAKPVMDEDILLTRERFYDGLYQVADKVFIEQGLQEEELSYGVTGGAFIQDIEADRVAFEGLFGTFALTFVIILGIILFAFRKVLMPLSSGLPLLGGAIVSAGVAYLVYGSLNMFSISFAVLLLGLGIDYGVHMMSRYQKELENYSPESALEITLKSSGISIIIGALTTGIAFWGFILGDFKAFEQMGIISGIGIIILCLMMFLMMPALLIQFGGLKPSSVNKSSRKGFNKHVKGVSRFKSKCFNYMINHPLYILGILIIVFIILIEPLKSTVVVGDIKKIYPDNMPSLNYAEDIKEAFGQDTNSVSLYADTYDELEKWIQDFEASDLILEASSILEFEEMPEALMNPELYKNYVSDSGKYLIEITSVNDIYNEENYEAFENEIFSITGAKPIGMPVLMSEVVKLVTNDIMVISTLCLLIVFGILLVVNRSVIKSLMTMLPLLLTLIFTVGIMSAFDIVINIFSIAAFPLIIGIGIDSSIHLMHRLSELDHEFQLDDLWATLKAISITTLTTVIGFLSLSKVNHPGMSSFGLAVAIGIGVCFVLTVVLVPMMSRLLIKRIIAKSKRNVKTLIEAK